MTSIPAGPQPGYSVFPLSAEQQRLWLVQEVTPQTTAYHVPAAVRVRGPLDVPALRDAWRQLVERHEALRTSLRTLGDTPCQHVLDTAEVDFAVVPAADGGDLPDLVGRAAYEPFDLATGPLVRTRVFQVGPDDHVLLVCAHHCVVDAWSLRLMLAELGVLYRARRQGDPVPLPELAVQYGDYAVWQRDEGAADPAAVAYWRRELADAPAHFSLRGAAAPETAAPAAAAGSVYADFDAELTSAVGAVATKLHTTVTSVLLAAWATALARHTGQPDVTVLTPVANRQLPETEQMVGFFVNMVVVRMALGDVTTHRELLARVHDRCVAAYAHQEVPFTQLVGELQQERQLGRTPFSDVMFGYQDLVGDSDLGTGPGWDGLELTPVDLPPRHAKCELTVEVRAHGGRLRLQADYRRDLFDATEIHDLVESFRHVLREITTDVEYPIAPPIARADTRIDDSQPGAPTPAAASDGPVEDQLRELAAELLGVPAESVGLNDDFFGLGGNSLLAARFVARVRAALDPGLELRTFLEQPTVANLAAHLGGRPSGTALDQVPLAPLPRPGDAEWRTPVSFSQQRLWLLENLTPGGAAYHVPVALRVVGELDVAALERALTRLTARHEVLRTALVLDDGLPTQCVHAAVTMRARSVDLTGVDPADRDQQVADLIAEESARPFDLARPPLLRLLAVRLAEAEHVLALTLHHIVCDGWSARILVRDLAALYVAETGGDAPALPALPVQYADFAAWQRAALSGDQARELVAYWKSALADVPAVLPLPLDRPRPAVQSYQGADLRFNVPDQLADGVRQLAGSHALTPFMVLLAAVGVTLGRYTGQHDVVVGTPVANRNRPELDELIGFFANTLALRVDTAGEPTGAELLARVRQSCLAAYAHQDLPFDQVVEAVAPARDLSTTPLFQVMLAVEDGTLPPVALPGLRVDLIEADAHVGKFDLTLVFADGAGSGVARYNTDLFDAATVERFVDHLLRVLAQLVAAPDRALAKLELLAADERRQQLDLWNQAPCHYETDVPLHDLVWRRAAAEPAAVAVSGCLDCHPDEPCNGRSGELTYGELGTRADRLAAALAASGVRRGDVVAILLDRSADLVVAELAVLTAGAAFLPLDPHHPPLRNTAIVADADCRAVVTTTRYADRVTTAVPVLPMDELPAAGPAPRPATAPKDLAYVIYTSGSTGQPKGALIDHGGIVNNLRWMQQDWPLDAGDRLLFKTVHTFDVAVKEIFWPLLCGARVVVAHPGAERDAHEICRHIAHHQATVVHLVPSMLDVVLEVSRERRLSLSSLRIVMSGAESLSPATHDALLARSSALLLHMYGPTETAIAVTGWPCREPLGAARLPLGRAMPNVRLYVLDDRLRPLPQGCVGELYVGGLAVGRGYLARPAETASTFLPDPFAPAPGERMYRTGDLVRYRNDGLLEFRGRRDAQVKIRGLRVEPGEVAATVARHPAVRQAAVTTWPRAGAGEPGRPVSLVAYVVADAGLTAEAVREYLRERLPSYLVPAYVELLPELPTGTNGKVDHQRLPAPAALDPDRSAGPDTPTTATERRLAEIWCEVLGLGAVGIHDNFFDLGGHSLLATRLNSRIRDAFGADVPLRALFEQPTIAALAKLVASADGTRAAARIPVIDRAAYRLPDDA